MDKETAEAILCKAFNLQVPASWDSIVKKRTYTIAARCNFDRITVEVQDALKAVGAIVPTKEGASISCYGQRWDPLNNVCVVCSVSDKCAAVTKSMGLDKIRPSPKLLGATATRTPTINHVPSPEALMSLHVWPRNERDESILAWLNEHLEPVYHNGTLYYQIQGDEAGYVFSVGKPEKIATISFLRASAGIKAKLDARAVSTNDMIYQYTLYDKYDLDTCLNIINEHVSEVTASL